MARNAQIFHYGFQDRCGITVRLAADDPRRCLEHGDFDARAHDLIGGFQSQHASADHYCLFGAVQQLSEPGAVCQMPDGQDVLLFTALERRNKALRSGCIDQPVIIHTVRFLQI